MTPGAAGGPGPMTRGGRLPLGVRHRDRPAQRRQVHPGQPHPGHQGDDHLARDRTPPAGRCAGSCTARGPGRLRRHAGPAPAQDRPRAPLERQRGRSSLDDVDVVIAVLDATAPIGPGDRLVLERASAGDPRRAGGREQGGPGVDDQMRVPAGQGARDPRAVRRSSSPSRPRPDVASTRSSTRSWAGCPKARPTSPRTWSSDVPEAFWVAELVREQLLAHMREELPHSLACRVDRVGVAARARRDHRRARVAEGDGDRPPRRTLKAVGIAVREQLPPGAFSSCTCASRRTGSSAPTPWSGSATDAAYRACAGARGARGSRGPRPRRW